jgi:hypothetical protein
MSTRYAVVAVFLSFIALFFALHSSYIGLDVSGTAHGQQGTHLALAEGFVANDLNFFEPQTRALNSASNDFNSNPISSSGITAAHFPIHAFIPALITKSTSGDLPSIFHWYSMLWGFVGLFFLYLLSLRITQNIGKSLFVVVFIATAPLFAFFQSSVLPEIPTLSCVIIGIYYLYRYINEKRLRFAWIGLAALLLAALTSPDLILYLVAGIILVGRKLYKDTRLTARTIFFLLSYILIFVLSEWHYSSVRSEYGSQFPGMLEDWTYDQTTANSLFGTWKMHYFTVFQSVLFEIVFIVLIVQLIKKQTSLSLIFSKTNLVVFLAFPGIVFALISPYQAYYSDVFFLKTLLPGCIFLLIFTVDRFNIAWFYRFPKVGVPAFLILLFVLLGEGNWTQMVRHEKGRTSDGSNFAFTFKGGDELLHKFNVKESDIVNVVIPEGFGIGQDVLANLDHNGIIREIPKNGRRASKFDKDHYVVCHVDERPFLFEHFETYFTELGSNGSIVLFKVIN